MALPGALGTAQQVLTAPVTAASGLFSKLAKDITDINAPFSAMLANLNSFQKAATSVGSALGEFVKAANPAVFQQFAFIVRDLQASIGIALVPALNFVGTVLRSLADIFYTVATPIAKLVDAVLKPLGEIVVSVLNAFGPLLDMFGQILKVVAEVVAPFAKLIAIFVKILATPIQIVFSALAKVLEILLIPIRLVAAALKFVVDAIGSFIDGIVQRIKKFLGIKDTEKASVGAAATNASLGGVESFQTKALTAAFQSGKGAESDRDVFDDIRKILNALPARIAEELRKFLGVSDLDPEKVQKKAEERGVSTGRIVTERGAADTVRRLSPGFDLAASIFG